jgi:uncharacterized protein (DUF488 family)
VAIKLFTIGFTKKNAAKFFGLLRDANVRRVIDTRLNRTSQLAGFAREQDLPFLLREICHAEYETQPLLAPTDEILSAYKKKRIEWNEYESRFNALMRERAIDKKLSREQFDQACLLCSEDKPHQCHRRLVAEYLSEKWGNVEVKHL